MPLNLDAMLSSPEVDSEADDRNLDAVGAVAVLGAMVEQRRRASSFPLPGPRELDDASEAPIAAQRRPRIDPSEDMFQKIR